MNLIERPKKRAEVIVIRMYVKNIKNVLFK